MRHVVLVFSILTMAVVGTGAALATESPAQANKQLVKEFLQHIRKAAGTGDPAKIRAVIEQYMTEDYIQHAQGVAPGREGYLQGWLRRLKTGGTGKISAPMDLYFVADGDLVVWVSERPSAPDTTPAAAAGERKPVYDFNMVRIAKGKLAEHWDSH
jgi:predicted SnoaL-like aldol condensation-catalyzing enzyme